jgi:hypothetical protein
MSSVSEPYGWPMELLRYLGGYETNVQPQVYVCPSVTAPPDPNEREDAPHVFSVALFFQLRPFPRDF